MQNIKKHLATILTILLISSMAITLTPTIHASAEVINGINYDSATASCNQSWHALGLKCKRLQQSD